ncbi:2-dehydro-3-deoxyphosphooctonate aldolase [Salmonella enterica subsp. enterica]|uniref:2-dehydro-3-deoxyphosphooctonate aldolase n=1 Tax=Salmonella enterica I TaxID=59201 RepID=A0A3S4LXQ0_SALET|nr:2-dehydro-3-deoxyphosphooctonate aldolase [Salmonella enterica subsp. enterica]
MKQKVVNIGDIKVANDLPFVLFGGMNVLESRDLAMRICEPLRNRYPEAGYSLRVQGLF